MFKRRDGKGFTLVEIMVVVAVIGILLAIGIPSFVKALESSRTKACIANLKQIKVAKTIWNLDSNTGTPQMTDLVTDYIRSTPSCPAGGTYALRDVNIDPTCTTSGHSL